MRERVVHSEQAHCGVSRSKTVAPEWLRQTGALSVAREFCGGSRPRLLECAQRVAVKDTTPCLAGFGIGHLTHQILCERERSFLRRQCAAFSDNVCEQTTSKQFIDGAQRLSLGNVSDPANEFECKTLSQDGSCKEKITRVWAQGLKTLAEHIAHRARHHTPDLLQI
jgi:hypothetical protein